MTARQWTTLVAVSERVVPALATLDERGRSRFREIIGDALMRRPASVRRQFAALLALVSWLPLVRFGRSFERLDGVRQDRVLRALQEAPAARLRNGFWGLRTLACMGYYAQPEVAPSLGYRPSLRGNEHLHA